METFDYRGELERERRTAEPVPPERQPLERLASDVGNRAFGLLAREGAGILPDGRAHPDVEAAIARGRGAGKALDPGARERFGPQLGDTLEDVRVHTGPEADALTQSVSARAFTTGADVYFAQGEYRPGTSAGDELLTHELAHVAQQRGASTSGPLVVSKPGDDLETEADAASGDLLG